MKKTAKSMMYASFFSRPFGRMIAVRAIIAVVFSWLITWMVSLRLMVKVFNHLEAVIQGCRSSFIGLSLAFALSFGLSIFLILFVFLPSTGIFSRSLMFNRWTFSKKVQTLREYRTKSTLAYVAWEAWVQLKAYFLFLLVPLGVIWYLAMVVLVGFLPVISIPFIHLVKPIAGYFGKKEGNALRKILSEFHARSIREMFPWLFRDHIKTSQMIWTRIMERAYSVAECRLIEII